MGNIRYRCRRVGGIFLHYVLHTESWTRWWRWWTAAGMEDGNGVMDVDNGPNSHILRLLTYNPVPAYYNIML